MTNSKGTPPIDKKELDDQLNEVFGKIWQQKKREKELQDNFQKSQKQRENEQKERAKESFKGMKLWERIHNTKNPTLGSDPKVKFTTPPPQENSSKPLFSKNHIQASNSVPKSKNPTKKAKIDSDDSLLHRIDLPLRIAASIAGIIILAITVYGSLSNN